MNFQFGAPNFGYNPQQTYFPQQPQQMVQPAPQPVQSPQPAFACRPVTNREEAVAAQTDYFSAGLIMPDLARGRIYFKRFNQQTGASDFYEFGLIQPEEPAKVEYITREEFEKFREEMKARKATVKKKTEVSEDDE